MLFCSTLFQKVVADESGEAKISYFLKNHVFIIHRSKVFQAEEHIEIAFRANGSMTFVLTAVKGPSEIHIKKLLVDGRAFVFVW